MPEAASSDNRQPSFPPSSYPPDTGTRRAIWMLVFLFSAAVTFGILAVPDLQRRPSARQAACAANLNGIGKADVLYADEHHVRPSDLGALARRRYDPLPTKMFVCPSRRLDESSTDETFEWQYDYVYLAPLPEDAPDGAALAFELPVNHLQHVGCLLRNDYSVARPDSDVLMQAVQRANDHIAARRALP